MKPKPARVACFKCGDASAPLYCINCAEEIVAAKAKATSTFIVMRPDTRHHEYLVVTPAGMFSWTRERKLATRFTDQPVAGFWAQRLKASVVEV